MAKKQIKQILIQTTSKGATDATKEMKELSASINEVESSVVMLSSRAAGIGTSLDTLSSRASSTAASLAAIATAGKGINSAFAGTAAQTAKLDGYITNLEILSSVLVDLARDAHIAEGALDGVNATSGMSSLINVLNQIQVNTGKAAGRIKETRDYVTDLDVTTGRTGETLEEFAYRMNQANQATERMGTSAATTTNNIRRLNKEGSSGARAFSALAFGANPLVSAYAAIAVNIYAVTEGFRVLNEASQFARLQEELNSFSAAVTGVDVSNLSFKMAEASQGALSLKESLEFATKGVAFNFTTDQLENLTAATRKASIALGRDFNDSMDRVLRGISKQEIELFDELGIVTRLTPAFQKYADQVGKTIDELTNYERQLALTNEVQGQLDDKFSGIEGGATAWEILGANTKNATDQLLVSISTGLEPYIAKLNKVLEISNVLSSIGAISKETTNSAEIFSKSLGQDNLGGAVTATGAISDKIDDLNKKLKESESAAARYAITMGSTSQQVGESFVNVAEKGASLSLLFLSDTAADYYGGQFDFLRTTFSDTKRYSDELERQKAIKAEVLKLEKERAKQLSKLAGLQVEGLITPETGVNFKAYQTSLNDTMASTEGLMAAGQKATGPLAEMSSLLKELSSIPKVVEEGALGSEAILEQRKAYEEFADTFKIANKTSLDGIGKVYDRVKELSTAYDELGRKDAIISINTGEVDEGSKDLERTIALRRELQVKEADLGKVISAQTVKKRKEELLILEAKLKQAKIDEELKSKVSALNRSTSMQTLEIENRLHYESEILDLKIRQLAQQIVDTDLAGKDTTELRNQLTILKETTKYKKAQETESNVSNGRQDLIAQLEQRRALAGSDKERVKLSQEVLILKRQEAEALTNAIEKNQAILQLNREQAQLDREKAAAPFADASSTFSSMQSLDGLSELQNVGAGVASNFANVFAQAAEAGKSGFGGFTEFLSGNMEAFNEFGIGLANAAGSIYSQLSDAKIAGIDREIEAEQRRDGKSAQSLAKIKKLEAEKIKEQSKSKKAQVIMSTAMAIMQGYAELGPIVGSISAVALTALGMLQISQINKAANGQVAALDSGSGSSMSIESGSRTNSVDLARNANAGELSYINGDSGTGGIQNFNTPGRLGGGSSAGGASITVGERGPEEITPIMPVSVAPSGSGGDGAQVVFNPVFHTQAIDSAGFEAVTRRYSVQLFESLERELDSRNLNIQKLA